MTDKQFTEIIARLARIESQIEPRKPSRGDLRRSKGWSAAQLGRISGTSHHTVLRMERGFNCHLKRLEMVSNALEVTPEYYRSLPVEGSYS